MIRFLRRVSKRVRRMLVSAGLLKTPIPGGLDTCRSKANHLESMRHLLPLSVELNPGLISTQAVLVYRNALTDFEKGEILEYPAIYCVGERSAKIQELHRERDFTDKDGAYTVSAGDHIGYRYEVRNLLGEGSYSQVFECIDRKTHRKVAVKMVKNNKQPLYDETLMLMRIRQLDPSGQSNCISVLNYGHFRNHYYVVLESFTMNFDTFLKNFPRLQCYWYRPMMTSILKALAFLKSHMIVHGDLKPANILVDTRNNVAKLADFGLSTLAPKKMTSDVYQSRFYRAPEVFCRGTVTPAIDMWSFACILAEINIGKPYLLGTSDYDQFVVIQQYLGKPPDIYFDECSSMHKFFTPTRIPNYCRERSDIFTGDRYLEVDPVFLVQNPGRLPPGSLNFNDDFPGRYRTHLRDFLEKCFRWNWNERIVPAFALSHPLFISFGEVNHGDVFSVNF